MTQSIVLGIGTGRCGTASLAAVLNKQHDAQSSYEELPWLPWQPRGGQELLRERFARFRRGGRKTILGDVASFYLPYLEDAIAVEPEVRVVCLRRPCEEVVASFCEWLDQNTPLATNHWARQPAPGWHHDPHRTRIYPQYDTQNREEGFSLYWHEYYQKVDELRRRWPEHIRVFDMCEALNTEAGLRDLLSFVGIPPERQVLAVGTHVDRGPMTGAARASPWHTASALLGSVGEAGEALASQWHQAREALAEPVAPESASAVGKRDGLPQAQEGSQRVPGPVFVERKLGQSPRKRPRRWARRSSSDPLDPRRCVVLVPFASSVTPQCERALTELERRGYAVRRVGGYAAIDQGRNQMATDALLDGFEETFWIDADVEFHPDAVDRLRSYRLPIAGGIYPQKGKRAIACHPMPGAPKIVFGKDGGLIEILYAGAGFLLVRREVYLAVQRQLGLEMCNERFKSPMIPFFHPMVHPCEDGHWYLAEDWAFCQRARQCGYQIMADTSIRLWHVGSYSYSWEDAGAAPGRFETYVLNLGLREEKGQDR